MNENISTSVPLVSIGLFVYNGAQTLRAAIDSILNQSFSDFELIISDNASSDDTENICCEYAQKDLRVRYIRQRKNQGASKNMQVVFDEARGEYFMWAAHDDVRSLDYVDLNLRFLQSHPDYVASTSPVMFEGSQTPSVWPISHLIRKLAKSGFVLVWRRGVRVVAFTH